ncbi:MAG TPA: ferrochelatase [Streptosporangiaceae bacterium]|nr:ferrochelatase [Streptosporangiaceae bacterium]
MPDYDALLVVSFGGPEGPADVMPFLRNVTAGRGVPDSRLERVAEHYYRFGGVSPINQQCRDLILAVQKDFEAAGVDLPVYWGNRNWQPYLADTLETMAADGVGRALAFVTSAYSSYSSCRQYLEDIERARAEVGAGVGGRAPVVDKIWPYYGHPAFAECFTAAATAALDSLPASVRDQADLVFTAHSIPDSMAERSGPSGRGAAGRAAISQQQSPSGRGGAYPAQLAEVAGRVAAGLGGRPWRLAYSSRSGPPAQPWLEPDVGDCLTELAEAGSRGVVVVPIGFVSDHMEVKFDLDIEAAETAAKLGLPFARAATPGTSPRFVAMITDLVRQWQAGPPPGGGFCTPGCCVPLARPQAAR